MDPYCLTMTDDVKLIFLTKMRYLGQKELLVKISDFLLQAIITWPIVVSPIMTKVSCPLHYISLLMMCLD